MKTEVAIFRDLNGFKVRQSSKTSMFNANDLLDLFNMTAKKRKKMENYARLASATEFKEVLLNDLNSTHQKNGELKIYIEEDILKTRTGRVNGGTWMHPYLFIHFAQWLSPEFNLACIKWIYDNLILNRNQAGDYYLELTGALKEMYQYRDPFVYQNEARMLNKLVFGTTESGQRQIASEEQLKLLNQIQKADVQLIKQGLAFYERIAKLQEFKKLL